MSPCFLDGEAKVDVHEMLLLIHLVVPLAFKWRFGVKVQRDVEYLLIVNSLIFCQPPLIYTILAIKNNNKLISNVELDGLISFHFYFPLVLSYSQIFFVHSGTITEFFILQNSSRRICMSKANSIGLRLIRAQIDFVSEKKIHLMFQTIFFFSCTKATCSYIT